MEKDWMIKTKFKINSKCTWYDMILYDMIWYYMIWYEFNLFIKKKLFYFIDFNKVNKNLMKYKYWLIYVEIF